MVNNSTRMVIEGDIIRVEETRILSEAPLASLEAHLTTRLPTIFPILPTGTIYAYSDPERNEGMVMVERQPKRTQIHIVAAGHAGRYRLALPYQYFVYKFRNDVEIRGGVETRLNFVVDSSYLFWRPTPYENPEDLLWNARIPNVATDANICWGNTQSDRSSFARNINDLTNNFNLTQFNGDLGLRTPDYGQDYRAWADASEDELVYLKWSFWENEKDEARTIDTIWSYISDQSLPRALQLDPSFVNIPEPPTNFTITRAREWINGLEPGQRRRMIAAIADTPAPRGREPIEPNPDPTAPAASPEVQ